MNPLIRRALVFASLFLVHTTASLAKGVAIPFELVNKNIFVQVRIGRSRPLWFLLDTGDKYAVIDLSVAKALELNMGEEVPVGGAGKNIIKGRLLKDSAFRVVGLPGFSQPLFLAVPLGDLSHAMGHPFDGTLGYDFINEFVVEIDYTKKRLTLHDKRSFDYHGSGDILPISFNAAAHPLVSARVIDSGRTPVDGTYVFDIGSGAAVIFNSPFVDQQGFLSGTRHVVPWLEGRGFGGGIDGAVGRIDALKLGSFTIDQPVAVFARSSNGPFASTDVQGNIGAAILEKFNVILDYPRKRIILERNAQFDDPIEYNRSGLSLTTEGADYKTVRIAAIAENAPASEAGLKAGDVVTRIDGRDTAQLTLTEIRRMLRDQSECDLTIRRGAGQLKVKLKLRRII